MNVRMKNRTKVTPPEIARRWGVSADKVLGWIRSGELRAMNVASKLTSRPRYLVDLADLAAFEERRAVIPPPPRVQQRRRRAEGVIEFF